MHALAIAAEINARDGFFAVLFESDTVSLSDGLVWAPNSDASNTLSAHPGAKQAVADLDVMWWRRSHWLQAPYKNTQHSDLINADCHAAFVGVLLTTFAGVWVSHPHATLAADNKLLQLKAAEKLGIRHPATLVSNSYEAVQTFMQQCGSEIIIKPVKGTPDRMLFTKTIAKLDDSMRSSMSLAPAIYQEKVQGDRHLRVCYFGDYSRSFEVSGRDLDWRRDGSFAVRHVPDDQAVIAACDAICRELQLRMGIFDFILTDAGAVFLEVNSQGQFLFLEGCTGVPLIGPFVDFLSSVTYRSNS